MAVTSTVLDVTLLLLCVSASVVTLGAIDVRGPDSPTAGGAADRLVAETTTVTYADADAPNGSRRVHATRAELLALVVERDADRPFDRRAVEAVRAGLGPRTRIDASVKTTGDSAAGDRGVPALPPSLTRLASATGRVAGGLPGSRSPGRPRLARPASDREPGDGSTGPANSVALGPEPPRNADISVAVVTQPIPGDIGNAADRSRESKGVVRVVVRRW